MTKLTTASGGQPMTASQLHHASAQQAPACSHQPVLITEQQVRLATAAAVPMPRRSAAQWLVALGRSFAVTTGLRAREAEADAGGYLPPRHYPSRWPSYLERACLGREMDRL